MDNVLNGSLTLPGEQGPQTVLMDGQQLLRYNNITPGELEMIVNVTKEYPFEYATVVFGSIMPFVLIFTLITNTLVVMVLKQPHMRTPTNIVLLTMAIVDLLTLLSPSPWYFYIYTLGYYDKFLYPVWKCYAHYIMTDVVPIFFHTSSVWLALLLAGQRYIYVCHPTLALTWCTVPRVKCAILGLVVTAFLHQSLRFFDNTFIPVVFDYNNATHLACKNDIADWVQIISVPIYYTTYFSFRIMFVFIIPITSLITLNVLLFRALRRAENKRTELLKTKFKPIAGGGANAPIVGPVGKASTYSDNINSERPSIVDISNSNLVNENSKKPSKITLADSSFVLSLSQIARYNRSRILFSTNKLRKHSTNSAQIKFASAIGGSEQQVVQVDSSELIKKRNSETIEESDHGTCSSSTASHQQRETARLELLLRQQNQQLTNRPVPIHHNEPSLAQKLLDESKPEVRGERDQLINDKVIDGSQSGCGDEDEFNCSECAAYEQDQQLYCRRCRAMASEGATGAARQNMSQCSSFAGCGTNTNDDSSFLATQNASSSIYVGDPGTLETIGVTLLRDETSNLDEANDINVDSRNENSEDNKLRKMNSADNRLVCGCMPAGLKGNHNFDMVGGDRVLLQKKRCRECCLANDDGHQNAIKNRFVKDLPGLRDLGGEGQWVYVATCSSSEPSLCGKNGKRGAGRNGSEENCNQQSHQLKRDDYSSKKPSKIIRSINHGQEAANRTKRFSHDFTTTGCTSITNNNTTTTTTTTTTTLYSTQNTTDSGTSIMPPLPTRQQQQQQLLTSQGSFTLKKEHQKHSTTNSAAPRPRETQSPSLISVTGRMSRGNQSLLQTRGSANQVPFGELASSKTATVSMRSTMDSNRTTLMLIVVVTVFLVVEVPVAAVTICHVLMNSFDRYKDAEWLEHSFNYIKLFTNFTIMVSYSINFSIYCSMSKKFRDTFCDLFSCFRIFFPRGNHHQKMTNFQTSQRRQTQPGTSHWEAPHFSTGQLDNHLMLNHHLAQPDLTTSINGSASHLVASTKMMKKLKDDGKQEQECEL